MAEMDQATRKEIARQAKELLAFNVAKHNETAFTEDKIKVDGDIVFQSDEMTLRAKDSLINFFYNAASEEQREQLASIGIALQYLGFSKTPLLLSEDGQAIEITPLLNDVKKGLAEMHNFDQASAEWKKEAESGRGYNPSLASALEGLINQISFFKKTFGPLLLDKFALEETINVLPSERTMAAFRAQGEPFDTSLDGYEARHNDGIVSYISEDGQKFVVDLQNIANLPVMANILPYELAAKMIAEALEHLALEAKDPKPEFTALAQAFEKADTYFRQGNVPDARELLKEIKALNQLEEGTKEEVSALIQEAIVALGDRLTKLDSGLSLGTDLAEENRRLAEELANGTLHFNSPIEATVPAAPQNGRADARTDAQTALEHPVERGEETLPAIN